MTTLIQCIALSKKIAHKYANGLGKFEKIKEGLGGKEAPIDMTYITQKCGIVGQVQDDGRSIRNLRGRWRMPKGTWTENAKMNLGDKFLRSDCWCIVHLDATPRGTLSVLWHS